MKKVYQGGALFIIGYLLSPLSFWNDLFFNIPIAYGAGFLFGLISPKLFLPGMIVVYWLTNLAGLLMMHYGALQALDKLDNRKKTKRLIINLVASLVYTGALVAVVKLGWLKFPLDYLK